MKHCTHACALPCRMAHCCGCHAPHRSLAASVWRLWLIEQSCPYRDCARCTRLKHCVSPPCPGSALRKEDGSFCPAHALADGRMERAGRAGRADLARPSTGHALTKSAGIVVVGDEILAAKVGTLIWLVGFKATEYTFEVASTITSGTRHVCGKEIDDMSASLSLSGQAYLLDTIPHPVIPASAWALQVEDVNTAFLCSELRAIGWHVKKVRQVLPSVSCRGHQPEVS